MYRRSPGRLTRWSARPSPMEVAARVQAAAEKLGYASIIVNTESGREREVHLLDMLRGRGVDGIIHAAVLRSDPSIARAATAPF